MQTLAAITRAGRIESFHKGFIHVTDPDWNTVYRIGDPDTKVFLRSAAKPIQAVALAYSGALDKFHISPRELAVICSSHCGEDCHRDAIRSILKKIGLGENDLLCGATDPDSQEMQDALTKKGKHPSQIHNCCSGKHSGILALCRYYGWPTENYTLREHPAQQLILETIGELLGCSSSEFILGVDDCGLPAILFTIKQASYLYSLLASGSDGTGKYKDAFELIRQAMRSHPLMVNGTGKICTDLIMHTSGRVIGKIGSEGIYCAAVPEKMLGVCIKIADGYERGVYPVIIHLLHQLGTISNAEVNKLSTWAYPAITDNKGKTVGFAVPVFGEKHGAYEFKLGDELRRI